MKSLTCWKVFDYTTSTGESARVVVGLDTEQNKGIIEEVVSTGTGTINGYTLYGDHNHYFTGFENLWMEYRAKHHVNSVTDVSDNY